LYKYKREKRHSNIDKCILKLYRHRHDKNTTTKYTTLQSHLVGVLNLKTKTTTSTRKRNMVQLSQLVKKVCVDTKKTVQVTPKKTTPSTPSKPSLSGSSSSRKHAYSAKQQQDIWMQAFRYSCR